MMNRQLADALHNATEFVLHVVDEVGRRTGLDKLEFGTVSRISDRSRTHEGAVDEEMDRETTEWQPPSTIWPIKSEATTDVEPVDDGPVSLELLDLPEIQGNEETDEEFLEKGAAVLEFPDDEPLDGENLLEFLDDDDEEISLSRASESLLEFLVPGEGEAATETASLDFFDAEAETAPRIRLTHDELGVNMAREMLLQASGGDPNDDPLDHLHAGADPFELIAVEEEG